MQLDSQGTQYQTKKKVWNENTERGTMPVRWGCCTWWLNSDVRALRLSEFAFKLRQERLNNFYDLLRGLELAVFAEG